MADVQVVDAGQVSGINPLYYWIGGGGLVIASAVFLYFKYGNTKATTPSVKTNDKSNTSTGTQPQPQTTVAGKTDYTGLATGATVFPNNPTTLNGLSVGEEVTIRGGASVNRLDEGLNDEGATELTADTALGTIWTLDATTVTVKAKPTFSYPFYHVSYADVNKKGSIVGKVEAVLSNLFDTGDKYIGADGFSE